MANVTPILRRTRHTATVPWDDFERVLQQAVATMEDSPTQVLATIGYTNPNLSSWRAANAAPLRAKYSLMGLLAEMDVKLHTQQTVERQLSYSDLLDLLSALAREPEPKRALIAVVARLIADY